MYKMNLQPNINVTNDFKELNQKLNNKGKNHLDEIMASTRDQARYIRQKDKAYQMAMEKMMDSVDQE